MFKGYDGYVHPPAEGVPFQRSFPWQTPVILTRSLNTVSMKDATALPVNFEDLCELVRTACYFLIAIIDATYIAGR